MNPCAVMEGYPTTPARFRSFRLRRIEVTSLRRRGFGASRDSRASASADKVHAGGLDRFPFHDIQVLIRGEPRGGRG